MAATAACVLAATLALGTSMANAQTPQPVLRGRAPAPAHEGGMALMFVGMHSLRGDNAENFEPGLRVGLMAGGYAFGQFSFNGEVVLDWTNPQMVPGVTDVTEFMGDVAFSPLFHAPVGNVELVIGPKLGWFYMYAHTDTVIGSATITANGLTVGLNGGVFVPVSTKVRLGLLLSYQLRDASEVCTTIGSAKTCQDGDDALGVFAFNAGLLF